MQRNSLVSRPNGKQAYRSKVQLSSVAKEVIRDQPEVIQFGSLPAVVLAGSSGSKVVSDGLATKNANGPASSGFTPSK